VLVQFVQCSITAFYKFTITSKLLQKSPKVSHKGEDIAADYYYINTS